MSEQTIHLDNAREAHDVLGDRLEMIGRIEQQLGIRLTSRDTWIRIEGPEENVGKATGFITYLREARQQGVWLHDQAITFALQAFQNDRETDLNRLFSQKIVVAETKPAIFPRTFGQEAYVRAITTQDIAFGIGPAGTGKTYLAMAVAVSTLLRTEVSRIILTRPAIEAGEALGFLPGDLHQKVLPYLRPLYDALYDMMDAEDIERFMNRGVIEVAPLAYMRGRTLNHAFVILDEAQNTTTEQMLMFLTRLGFDSKCVITGDLTQVDLPASKTSGLLEARHMLTRVEGISFTELTDEDVVRHTLVQKVIQAYRSGRSTGDTTGKSLDAESVREEETHE